MTIDGSYLLKNRETASLHNVRSWQVAAITKNPASHPGRVRAGGTKKAEAVSVFLPDNPGEKNGQAS